MKVSEKGKEVHYWLEANALAKKNHGPICSAQKAATVTGTVSRKDGKAHLTATAIKYD